MDQGFEFAQPLWFFALLVPLLLEALAFYHPPQYKRIRRFADTHLLPFLQKNVQHTSAKKQRKHPQRPSFIWALVWLMGVLALAQPRWGYEDQEVSRPSADVMIMLDLSDSMRVEDLPHSRFEQAIQEVETLLKEAEKLNIGLMVFAGIPHLVMPLSDDYDTLKNLLYDLSIDLIPVQGSRLNLALEQANLWLKAHPQNTKHIVLISDGEFTAEEMSQSQGLLKNLPVYLHTLGVGSVEGGSIPLKDASWKKDPQGKVIISRLNQQNLATLAQAGRGSSQIADYRDAEIKQLINYFEKSIEVNEEDKMLYRLWHERFHYFLLVMAFAMLPWFRGTGTMRTVSS